MVLGLMLLLVYIHAVAAVMLPQIVPAISVPIAKFLALFIDHGLPSHFPTELDGCISIAWLCLDVVAHSTLEELELVLVLAFVRVDDRFPND